MYELLISTFIVADISVPSRWYWYNHYLTEITLSLHAVSSMLRTRGLTLKNLLYVVFPLSIFHGSCALDITFKFSTYIYCYCLVLGIFSSTVHSLWAWKGMFAGVWNAGFIVDVFCYFLFCFMWIILAVELIHQRNRLRLVIQDLEEVDTVLKSPKYNAAFYLIPIFCAIFANVVEKLIAIVHANNYVLGLGYYFHMSPIVTFSSQYVFLMGIASDQFSFITLELQSSRKFWKINNLVGIHKGLCDTAAKINGIFNLHLLITTSVPFIIISLKFYSAIMCIQKPDDYNNLWLFFENVFYITMNTIILWCIVNSSSSIKDKVFMYCLYSIFIVYHLLFIIHSNIVLLYVFALKVFLLKCCLSTMFYSA